MLIQNHILDFRSCNLSRYCSWEVVYENHTTMEMLVNREFVWKKININLISIMLIYRVFIMFSLIVQFPKTRLFYVFIKISSMVKDIFRLNCHKKLQNDKEGIRRPKSSTYIYIYIISYFFFF